MKRDTYNSRGKNELRRQTIKETDTNIDILESIKPSDNIP